MTLTYQELLEQDYARQVKFNHVDDYHKSSYKGEGLVILNAEGDGDHREMTTGVLRDYAPGATIIESIISIKTSADEVLEATITVDGEQIDFEQAIDKYNIKIVTRSYSGSSSTATLNYLKEIQKRKGIIFFNSAANESDENGIWSKYNTAITVSACKMYEDSKIKVVYYGSFGEVDFTCFMAKGRGTSAASPALAAETALILGRYGDFNQVECVEILKNLCIKLEGEESYKFGYGLPILPLTDKLEVLEKLRGAEEMQFKDVEDTRWSKAAIDFLTNKGELKGFEDGTFRPSEPLTREQYAQARYNQIKLEKEI